MSAEPPPDAPSPAALHGAAFDHAPDAIFLTDDALHYVDANPAACELLGYTRGELRRLTVPDLTPEEDRHRIPGAVAALRTAGRLRTEWRLRAKDGTVRVVDVCCAANVLPGMHLAAAREPAPRAAAPGGPPRPPAKPPQPGRAVLLVEDEEAVREFVRFVLEQAGYTVVPAADGEQALALFRPDPDRFDLVLSDVLMPKRTGPEVAAELRRLRPGVRIVFMSGFTGGSAANPIDMPPGATLLEKPFSLDRLLGAVAAAIGGQ